MRKLYQSADKAITFSFYFLLFTVPLLFTPWNSELFELPKMLLAYTLTTVIVASWAVKALTGRAPVRSYFRRTPLDIFLLIFLVSQFFSFLVSIDPHTSLFGYYSRSHGGLLSTTSYLLLYWAFVSNMDMRKTQNAIRYLLSAGIIVSIWGALEHFGISPSCLILRGELNTNCWIQDVQNRVFATLGQPNWMAAWLVALSPIAWAIGLNSPREAGRVQFKVKNFIWLGISALFFLALLYTKSRSGLLGFSAAYTLFWGLLLIRTRTKEVIRTFLLFTFTFLILALASGTPLTPYSSPVTSALETGGTESGEIRKIVWKGAIDIWSAYPILGSGVETFAYTYYNFRPIEHNLTSEWDFLYNKAHNEYLNYLATTGVVGLSAYLLVIVLSLRLFYANIQRILVLALGAGYTSILITNFFGFSVVPVAILFFLFPAMVLNEN